MSERVLSPIRLAPSGRYFETFDGQPFLFIGFNDAISWPRLKGLYRREDVEGVETYLQQLATSGVTVLRLMLEYAHHDSHFFEKPVGSFNSRMVQLWDDLLMRCERYGLRVLLTPWDTFWMARRWYNHPYNAVHGGPAAAQGDFFPNEATVQAGIRRLQFVIERWGNSGVIAAWDLFNEIHTFWGGSVQHQSEVIARISHSVRETEQRLHGFTRLQTVSVFGPEPDAEYEELVFRHPCLDFATTHIYSKGAIDHPRNTITPAVAMAQWTRHALDRIPVNRPFTDSEHGPIHLFNDRKKTLPEAFDDEYERHLMWTHLACGGAGSGMRWPARHPHVITPGTMAAYKSMGNFARLIDWRNFASRNADGNIKIPAKGILAFGCADDKQAVLYLLRGHAVRNTPGLAPPRESLHQLPMLLRNMTPGAYDITLWQTRAGCANDHLTAYAGENGVLQWTLPCIGNDLAIAIRSKHVE